MQVSVGNENSNCNCCRFPVSVSQQCPIPIIKGNTVTGCMNRISTWEVYKFVFLLNFRLKVLALLFLVLFGYRTPVRTWNRERNYRVWSELTENDLFRRID